MSHADKHIPAEQCFDVRMGHVEWAGLTEDRAGCCRDVTCAERQFTATFAAHCAQAGALSVRLDSAPRRRGFDIPVRCSRTVTLVGRPPG